MCHVVHLVDLIELEMTLERCRHDCKSKNVCPSAITSVYTVLQTGRKGNWFKVLKSRTRETLHLLTILVLIYSLIFSQSHVFASFINGFCFARILLIVMFPHITKLPGYQKESFALKVSTFQFLYSAWQHALFNPGFGNHVRTWCCID